MKFNCNKKDFGFSLIELSIVLIIIGLLVAGVTGGASLIESARARAFASELTGYRQAIMTFYAANDRYPGDIKNTGKFGWFSDNEPYSKSDFAAPFNSTSSFTPLDSSAPWIELYTEGITDFEPTNAISAGGAYPESKVLKDIYCSFYYYTSKPTNPLQYMYGVKPNTVVVECKHKNEGSSTNSINAKLVEKIDRIMDDGIYNSGIIRGQCYGSGSNGHNDYKDAMDNKKTCSKIWYVLQLPK